MILLVGLGNIGKEYEDTRHNFGFMVADELVKKFNLNLLGKKFHSEVYSGVIEGEKVLLIKPQTYMNRSGIAVSEAARFYKIPLKDVFVFHDDMDICLGKIKIKNGGSSGGHKGIKSIDEMVGASYNRIRLGVGRPEINCEVVNFVTNKFGKNDRDTVNGVIEKIINDMNNLMKNRELFLTNFSRIVV